MTQLQTPIEEDLIREKAHELWLERGCPDGTPDEDWYRAEQLLREAGPAQSPAEPRPKKSRSRKR
jgi:hypothetical protein